MTEPQSTSAAVRLELGLRHEEAEAVAARLDHLFLLHEVQGSELVIPAWRWAQVEDPATQSATLRAFAIAAYGSTWACGCRATGEVPLNAGSLWRTTRRAGLLLWSSGVSHYTNATYWIAAAESRNVEARIREMVRVPPQEADKPCLGLDTHLP